MKKHILPLLVLPFLLLSCNTIKVNRTVSKTITLSYNINSSGAFSSVSRITADKITNIFQPDFYDNRDSKVERFDVNSFNIAGTINEDFNTASEVTVKAVVTTAGTTPLLNDTKLIRIGGNKLLQNVTDLFNAVTGDIKNEVSFANALLAINAVGVQKVQKIISENLDGVNTSGLTIQLNGMVPEGQRLVGNITLTINATITYTRCELWTDFPLPLGFPEC